MAFFLQMAAIIAVCRIVGWLAKRYPGQPQAVPFLVGVAIAPGRDGLING